MMSWRVHLANQAIRTLYVLPAKSPILAVWTRPARVELFDLTTGASLGEHQFDQPPDAPSNDEVPLVRDTLVVPFVRDTWYSEDGRTRARWAGGAQWSYTHDDTTHEHLQNSRILAVDMDRQNGAFALMEEDGTLGIFQGGASLGRYDIGLRPTAERRASLAISRGGQALYATDGQSLVATNAAGRVRKRLSTHYEIGLLACSPSGAMVATTDNENGVLRVYRGEDLVLTHQKFAIDLVTRALQVQLLADLPPAYAAISGLTLYLQGIVAFAMAGVVCVSDLTLMDELSKARLL
jgi:hypothetical protein